MPQAFHTHRLSNGLTLLAEPMAHVSSAAMALLVRVGSAHDAPAGAGAAAVAAEWCLRGAGERDTRQLNDALAALGCQHGESVRSEHLAFSAVQLGRNLADVLEIWTDILRRPRLDAETFEPCRDLTVQDLAALEDEPARKCNLMLRERFYPEPLGRCVYGTAESLAGMSAEGVRRHVREHFTPDGAILAVAGKVDFDALATQAERLLGDWPVQSPPAPRVESPVAGVLHVPKQSAQTHIALAHRSVPIHHEQYYAARLAEAVLSGGMSSRLFTEVREKRGLVYHVSSHYHSLREHAGMFTYAGTRPEQAQETFDVTVGELRRLAEGIEDRELATARTQLKSSLVMQGESTTSRAGALAGDFYHLGRLRPLAEIADAVDAVTADDVLAHLAEKPAEKFTILVIGPEPLDTRGLEG